jgi:SprT protein
MAELNGEKFWNRTPAHELAHIYNFAAYGGGGHGKTWKKIMHQLGQPASVHHQMKLPNGVNYVCGCRTHSLTPTRHKKIESGKAEYYCKKCGTKLILSEEQDD